MSDKIIITITLETEDMSDDMVEHIMTKGRHLMADAFSDFKVARQYPGEYVTRRYPNETDEWRVDKAEEVQLRYECAEALRNTSIRANVERITNPEERIDYFFVSLLGRREYKNQYDQAFLREEGDVSGVYWQLLGPIKRAGEVSKIFGLTPKKDHSQTIQNLLDCVGQMDLQEFYKRCRALEVWREMWNTHDFAYKETLKHRLDEMLSEP